MNFSARPAWRNSWAWFAVAGFFGLATLGSIGAPDGGFGVMLMVTLLFVGIAAYKRYSALYTIQEGRVQAQVGIISRDVKTIRLSHLRNCNMQQSLFQRMFNVGNLELSSSGGGGIEVTFKGIIDPMDVKNQVEDAAERDGGRPVD